MTEVQVKEQGAVSLQMLETMLLQREQVDCPVYHRFSPGLYIREVHIPADTLAIGHYQKFEHLNIFLKGVAIMLQKDGSVEVFRAPMIFTGTPGRKCGYITEDAVWLNVYPTEERDVEKLEAHFLDKDRAWDHFKTIDDLKRLKEKTDSEKQESFDKLKDNPEIANLPIGDYKFQVSSSNIGSKGIFASATIYKGEAIGPLRIDGLNTILGQYINSSENPNAEEKDGILYATKDIGGNKGGFLGTEITKAFKIMEA